MPSRRLDPTDEYLFLPALSLLVSGASGRVWGGRGLSGGKRLVLIIQSNQ